MAQEVEFKWNGDAATRLAREGAVAGLHVATEHLLGESTKLVPLDEGMLQDSGRTAVDEQTLVGAVIYDTPYAVVQHEDFSLYHPNGRQAKYLEEPWLENRERYLQIVGTHIKRALKS